MVKKDTVPFYQKFAFVIVGLIGFVYLVVLAKQVLDPLIFGFLFAILLLPVANLLEKRLRLPRAFASILSMVFMLALAGGVIYLVESQIAKISNDWPMLKSQVGQSLNDVSGWIDTAFHIDSSKQLVYVEHTKEKIMQSGTNMISTAFGAVSSLMLFYSFIMIFTFFILLYRRILFQFIIWVFSDEYSATVNDIVQNIQSILRQYILGLLLEMFIVACLACSAFFIIGIKYAVLLGIIVALFNIIPYVGIFTALLLSTLITFATGNIKDAVIVAISVLGIHAIDANFLLPTIVGSKVKLNALVTFLAIISGEMIWGLSGMFLSIPMMAIFKIIFDRVESLKPWGYLFGSGTATSKSRFKKRTPKLADES